MQTRDTDKNALGEYDGTYTEIAKRRVSIEPLNGREYFAGSGEQGPTTTRIRLRWDSTIKVVEPHSRIVDISVSPNVTYDIQSVINVRNQNRELVLMCLRR